MNLYIVRHAETYENIGADGSPDTNLTELGLRQADCLGRHFRNIRFDKIYSSHLTRAVRTAAVIAEYQEARPAVTVVPEFAERGVSVELEADTALHRSFYERIEYTGTSIPKKYAGDIERIQEAFNTYVFHPAYDDPTDTIQKGRHIIRTNPADILIVAHGSINAVMLSCLVGFRFDINMNIVQQNTCVNRFSLFLHDGVPRIKFIGYNDISHLPPELRTEHP